jgi:hypothetical protein
MRIADGMILDSRFFDSELKNQESRLSQELPVDGIFIKVQSD